LINHFQDTYRVLNDRGSFFLNIGDTFDDGNLQNIPHRVVIGLQEKGWVLRNTIIWNKTNPKPSSSKTNLTPSYEFIFHLVKSKDYFYRQVLTEMKDKSKSSLPPRHRNMGQNNVSKVFPYIPRNGKNIGDYWDEGIVQTAVANQFKSTTKTEHPAPFPEQIVILPLLQTTNPNDLVLDTFHGSGTTGKVSTQYGRRFVGYDLKTY
jgi:DNA modification methylase